MRRMEMLARVSGGGASAACGGVPWLSAGIKTAALRDAGASWICWPLAELAAGGKSVCGEWTWQQEASASIVAAQSCVICLQQAWY